MFAESLSLDPDEVLGKDAFTNPHRTIIDAEQAKIDALNKALKQAIIKELQSSTQTV